MVFIVKKFDYLGQIITFSIVLCQHFSNFFVIWVEICHIFYYLSSNYSNFRLIGYIVHIEYILIHFDLIEFHDGLLIQCCSINQQVSIRKLALWQSNNCLNLVSKPMKRSIFHCSRRPQSFHWASRTGKTIDYPFDFNRLSDRIDPRTAFVIWLGANLSIICSILTAFLLI